MYRAVLRSLRPTAGALAGLATGETAQAIVGTGGAAAASLLPTVTTAAWAVPVVGAAVAGVTLALGLIFNRKSGRQKVAATKIVESIQEQLQANLDGYMAGPRTRSSQAAALANYDAAWAWLSSTDGLLNPELGDVGKRSLAERAPNGRYALQPYYRDPIANDPEVKPDPANVAAQLEQAALGNPWLIPAAALIAIGVLV